MSSTDGLDKIKYEIKPEEPSTIEVGEKQATELGMLLVGNAFGAVYHKARQEFAAHIARLETLARQYKSDRDHVEETCRIQRERIAELEKRLVVPTIEGKTPGDVAKVAFAKATQDHHESEGFDRWAFAANAVLRAFPTRIDERVTMPMSFDFYFGDLMIPGHISPDELHAMIEASVGKQVEAHAKTFERDGNQRAAEALGRVRERLCAAFDASEDPSSFDDTIKSIVDSELASLEGQDLTGPKKPTKPAESEP